MIAPPLFQALFDQDNPLGGNGIPVYAEF